MRILLVQTAFLGDTILSTPVVENLKSIYPNADIYTLTTPLSERFFKYNPNVYKTLTYDKKNHGGIKDFFKQVKELKSYNFDMVFSLQKSHRTSLMLYLTGIKRRVGFKSAKLSFLYTERIFRDTTKHDALRNLSILSNETLKEGFTPKLDIKLYLPSREIIGEGFIEEIERIGSYIVLSPGSVWNTKRWDKDEYKALLNKLLKEGYNVICSGSKSEFEICDYISNGTKAINLAGRTTIEQTMYLVSKAKGVVCNDSMMLHLTSAFKVPCVVVFCATVPEFGFGPWQNEKAVILEDENLKCRPCGRHGTKVCKLGTNACQKVSHLEVYKKLMEIIK